MKKGEKKRKKILIVIETGAYTNLTGKKKNKKIRKQCIKVV